MISVQPHTIIDIEFYLCFLFGQFIFLLNRAGAAARKQTSTILTRRKYFTSNLDIIAIRTVIESVFIYYPIHHWSIAQIIKPFGIDLTNSTSPWIQFLTIVPSSPISAIAIGLAADYLLDKASIWSKTPTIIRNFIHENVPELPTAIVVKTEISTTITKTPINPV